jgi:hypothetical protein
MTKTLPKCKLINTDGNIFSLGGIVATALRKAGQGDKVAEFTDRLFNSKDYAAALKLMAEYVEIE